MIAVVQTGGKQYKVAAGDVISIEKLEGNAGDKITFDKVLLVGDAADLKIGKPYVEKAVVIGELVRQAKGEKLVAYKHKRRKNYERTVGHRQKLTMVKIEQILPEGSKK
ncbi:MAG TPA: 50S ribosomal protein L21 [bacterium]|nr:50S ribosomal protein L21 [bacterium]